jgi:hypothetical protein
MATRNIVKELAAFVIKTEAARGVPEDLVTADANIRIREADISDIAVVMDNDSAKYMSGDHTRDEAIPGMEPLGFNFSLKACRGTVTGEPGAYVGNLPYEKCLLGTGLLSAFDETLGKWTLTPNKSANNQTYTAALYEIDADTGKGTMFKGAGLMSNLVFGADGTSKPFMFQFDPKGKVGNDPTDPAILGVRDVLAAEVPEIDDANILTQLALTNSDTVIRLTRMNEDGTPHTSAETHDFCSDTLSFNSNSEIVPYECQSDSTGILASGIVSRGPAIQLNPVMGLLEDFNYWNAITKVVLYKIEITKYNDADHTTGNEALRLTIPLAQQMTIAPTESNGYMRNAKTFRALRNRAGADQTEREADYKLEIWGVDID